MQDIRLNNPQQVKRLLNRTINDLLQDKIGTDKARCLGYLSTVLLKAVEIEDFGKRLEELEKQINGGKTA
jgi:hypothetical protein